MVWGPFSAETVILSTDLQRLFLEGRTSDALIEINVALERAYQKGPSNISYEEFNRTLDKETIEEQRASFRNLLIQKDREKAAA